jgi:hypothetical protein
MPTKKGHLVYAISQAMIPYNDCYILNDTSHMLMLATGAWSHTECRMLGCLLDVGPWRGQYIGLFSIISRFSVEKAPSNLGTSSSCNMGYGGAALAALLSSV